MTVATADLHRAIEAAWDAAGLDDAFKALWDDPTDVDFVVLDDQEAAAEQPFPYCVMDQTSSATTDRMSGTGDSLWEVRDVSVSFNVQARRRAGDARTAKEIAVALAAEIMKVFGGHPVESPAELSLDNGNFLLAEYQNDFGIRTGEDEYQWRVDYLFRLDVPVAV